MGDAIEKQLAHDTKSSVRAVYNHAQHLEERRKIMQVWADFLDLLRDTGEVPNFQQARQMLENNLQDNTQIIQDIDTNKLLDELKRRDITV